MPPGIRRRIFGDFRLRTYPPHRALRLRAPYPLHGQVADPLQWVAPDAGVIVALCPYFRIGTR